MTAAAAEDDWGPPFDVKPREMTLDSDGVTLSMTVWERARKPVEVPEGKRAPKIKEGAPEAPPRSWCLLVHGLLSDRNEFGEIAERLGREGYGVVAVDLRGHGKSGGARGVYDIDRNVADLKNVIRHFETREEQWDLNAQQWGIIGHSLGALTALKLGRHLHAEDVIVAVSPPRTILEETTLPRRFGYWLAYRLMGGRNGDEAGPTVKYEITYRDLFADPAARERAERLGFLQGRIPVRNYPLLKAVHGEEIAREVQDPSVLVVWASKDRVIRQSASRAVYDAIASAKQSHVIEGSGHSIFLDAQRSQAADFLVQWLNYRLEAFNEVRVGHTKR